MADGIPRALGELAAHCGAQLIGDATVLICGIASIESAKNGDIVFADSEHKLSAALACSASAVIAGNFASAKSTTKPLLIAADPKLAFTRVAQLLIESPKKEGIAPSAQVHASAKAGLHVRIDPGVIVDERVQIGDFSVIGANSVIGTGVMIGEQCRIGPNVTIYPGTELGNRVVVQAGTVLGSTGFGYVRDERGRYQLFPQVGRLLVEDDVEIGANCTIDRGALDATVIRRGSKLDNMVHVGHNVQIGEDVVIAAQTGISGSSQIGSRAIVGGQVGIAEHVRVEDGAILGAQSGVPSNKVIRGEGVVFWGTPARPIKGFLKELAVLARLARKQDK